MDAPGGGIVINLGQQPLNRPTFVIFRMLIGKDWRYQEWEKLPMPAIILRGSDSLMAGTSKSGGYVVESISRWTFPDEDRAAIYIDTGYINGEDVTPLDLSDYYIRIMLVDDESFPNGATEIDEGKLKTVFCGTVVSTQNSIVPGVRKNHGRTTYFLAGAVSSRARKWPMDRHATATMPHAKGHPGYNFPLRGYFRKVLGNKGWNQTTDPYGDFSSFISYYQTHQLPLDGSGYAASWTDADAVKHAIASSRAFGEPLITVDLSDGAFTGTNSWDIAPGTSCWDFIRRVCDRRRGRGAVFVEYTDGGELKLEIKIKSIPQHDIDLTYNTPSPTNPHKMESVRSISGAAIGLNAVDVDLVGDHRLDGPVSHDKRESSLYDTLLLQGEKIQVLANISLFGSTLANGWSTQDQAAFSAIPIGQTVKQQASRWRHIFRRFVISSKALLSSKASSTSTQYPINYYCEKSGAITVSTSLADKGLTSELTSRILPDLPIYEGWRYDTTTPEPWGGSDITDYMPPPRMPPILYYLASDTDILPLHYSGYNIQTDDFGVLLHHAYEDAAGARMLATQAEAPAWFATASKIGIPTDITTGGLDRTKLMLLVGVELGNHVSLAYTRQTVDDYWSGKVSGIGATGRRLVMNINGPSLWLAAPGAIWELDYKNTGQLGYRPGLKIPVVDGNIPYIVRDDRATLSFIGALASYYYLTLHSPSSWSLRSCGLSSEFQTVNGSIKYPSLGQFVGKIRVSDSVSLVSNTNITCIHYDHNEGLTTWKTDYVDYDGNLL